MTAMAISFDSSASYYLMGRNMQSEAIIYAEAAQLHNAMWRYYTTMN